MKLVKITTYFKDGVLDPQGTAIKEKLLDSGYEAVKELKAGKVFEITLDVEDEEKARALVKEICKKLLVNPVIEDYKFEIVEA